TGATVVSEKLQAGAESLSEAASNVAATTESVVADSVVTKTEDNEKQASPTVEQVVETKADATST
ncbi:unnamed protein product, partial [Rotaria magnacalcarata]